MMVCPKPMLSANGRHPQLMKRCVCECSFAVLEFVGDRTFDPGYKTTQCGAAPLLKVPVQRNGVELP